MTVLDTIVTPANTTGNATTDAFVTDFDAVIESYNKAHGQTVKNLKGEATFRDLYIAAAQLTHVKVQVEKKVTAVSLADYTTNKRKVQADWAKGVAFGSDQSTTYFAWVGRFLSLPGDLPEDVKVTSLNEVVMVVTAAEIDRICSIDGMTVPTAWEMIKKAYDDKKATLVTPEKILGQALKAAEKVAKLEAEWTDKADATLAALMAEVKALVAVRASARLAATKLAYEEALRAAGLEVPAED